ncbi:hypothetical protein NCCP2716_06020 [Sporosarcina sp. NCCP-2716]|uniref:hypothetical protein n=1 Tax=Sporosarcina sp. NCCP-2716 TaxID=2943679 RepID=UPI00203BCE7E|nr:hypothetical protein [Sporosarcina sp. NCCP-2716]GKV68104.1 hypothetical protein NCCP2716_06020 [Sporosarcina sp. NCCP-2716]
MQLHTFFWTAAVAGLFSALSLKFLHIFHFVSWSPVGWMDRFVFLTKQPSAVKWTVFILLLFVLHAMLYGLFTAASQLPPSVMAILMAIIVVCAVEWAVTPPASLKSAYRAVSIPLLALAAIIMRFVSGTAVFMDTEVKRKAK